MTALIPGAGPPPTSIASVFNRASRRAIMLARRPPARGIGARLPNGPGPRACQRPGCGLGLRGGFMRIAVVPAKDFGTAKQRLGRALPGEARSALARAMLEDVLAALG